VVHHEADPSEAFAFEQVEGVFDIGLGANLQQ